MIDAISSLLHVVLVSLGVLSGVQPTVTLVAVALVAALLATAILLSIAPQDAARTSLARPRRGIDVSALIAQSDPDAAGHPRSRAPGSVASAA